MATPDFLAILTYHSISSEAGPTSISPAIFREQMNAIASADVDVVDLSFVERWLAGDEALRRRTIAITFDDAFRDFADCAFPELSRHRFASTVFVPTAVIGGAENWIGANAPQRPLMDWRTIKDLSRQGVSFGSHTRTHRNLTSLSSDDLRQELADSRKELEDAIGSPAPHFAPPYGASNEAVREEIARHYDLSVGVKLGEARNTSPRFDLPRIEMHYYRDGGRWRAFLSGDGRLYLEARRAARRVRQALIGSKQQYPQ